jgi:hypothetical protein
MPKRAAVASGTAILLLNCIGRPGYHRLLLQAGNGALPRANGGHS